MTSNPTAVLYKWNDLPQDHPMQGLARRRVIGQHAMISRVELSKGCDIPIHAHANEQFACVISGSARFGIGGDRASPQEIIATAGDVLHLPAHVPHSCYALEDTLILDVFSPPSQKTGIDRT